MSRPYTRNFSIVLAVTVVLAVLATVFLCMSPLYQKKPTTHVVISPEGLTITNTLKEDPGEQSLQRDNLSNIPELDLEPDTFEDLAPPSYHPPPGQQKYDQYTRNANESISFYVIAGNSQQLTHDLRGNYYEFQLKQHRKLNATMNYISDGPLTTNGIEFLVLPEGSSGRVDATFCHRTPESWIHFIQNHNTSRWYFRGTHDTFVNVTSLLDLIYDLETQYGDPMSTYMAAYNCHEWNYILYPHGGTGWLFSNYAVKQFVKNLQYFRQQCGGQNDDVAMAHFLDFLGEPVMKFQTNKFIVTWPNTQGDVIYKRKWKTVPKCPPFYKLYPDAPGFKPAPALTAASIHMHRVPMNEAWDQLRFTDPDAAVTFTNPNTPVFCMLK